jgi:hypothetical protein
MRIPRIGHLRHVQRSSWGDTGLKGRVTRGLETTEANENRQGNDRRGVDGMKKTQSKESAPRAFSKEGFEGISTSDPAQGRQ